VNIEQARSNMIEQQLRTWEVLDERVLEVMAAVPRECFVPQRYRNLAFADTEIPLGRGQIMMAPKIEGRMLQALDIRPSDQVLEIGTGSGFITACLARLGQAVETVDIIEEFVQSARIRIAALGARNVHFSVGDAANGWGGEQCFDAIAVTSSLPEYRTYFEQQLTIGGRLFVVVGEPPAMSAILVSRIGETEFSRVKLFETDLPPLLNFVKTRAFAF
jgi:protein-L-isoaspartate(D-aspartate) O-methyltransferase